MIKRLNVLCRQKLRDQRSFSRKFARKKTQPANMFAFSYISTSISIKHPKMLKQQLITTLIKIADVVKRVFSTYNVCRHVFFPLLMFLHERQKNEINQFFSDVFGFMLMKFLIANRSIHADLIARRTFNILISCNPCCVCNY